MKRTYVVIMLYIICVLCLYAFKPAIMFDANGELKHFNYEDNDTSGSLLSIEIALCILALLCYFVVIALELIFHP